MKTYFSIVAGALAVVLLGAATNAPNVGMISQTMVAPCPDKPPLLKNNMTNGQLCAIALMYQEGLSGRQGYAECMEDKLIAVKNILYPQGRRAPTVPGPTGEEIPPNIDQCNNEACTVWVGQPIHCPVEH